jgi:hypothetical protein
MDRLDEKILEAYEESILNERKKKFDQGLDEQKLVFKGHHLKDNLLDEITLEELFDTVGHNIPKEKIDARSMMKEFESILKTKVSDARFMAKKVIPEMVKELKKGE